MAEYCDNVSATEVCRIS